MGDLLRRATERYFELKAKRWGDGVTAEDVRKRCKDRLPSDQMIALIEILDEEEG